ncbi:MAG: hypothetical protein ACLQU2_04215 [Candidatus Binataceae bacterium]
MAIQFSCTPRSNNRLARVTGKYDFRLLAALGLSTLLILSAASAVLAQVGNRNFFEPLIVQDPNPSNEIDLLPQWIRFAHGEVYALPFSLEKQLSANFSVQVGSSWGDPSCDQGFLCDGIVPERRGRVQSRHSRRRRSRVTTTERVLTGFSDLEILTKYAFFASDKHETRLALGTDLFLPAGNPTAGGNTHTHLGPIFMFAKGFGDIPNHGFAKYLRPFAIQGDVEYLYKTGGTLADDTIVDWDISYSLQYLNDYVCNLNLQPQVRNLIPFAEFTYEQVVRARYAGTPPDLAMLPGVAYMTDTWQVSLATALALNHATVEFDHAAVITMLSITLDKIFPDAGRTLF